MPDLNAAEQLVVSGIGATDWTGDEAPAGGGHAGISVVTMTDGVTHEVAYSIAEVARLVQHTHPVPPGSPRWVSFDQPNTTERIVLNTNQIRFVQEGATLLSFALLLSETTFLSSGTILPLNPS
jgi:hypothetical protein